MQVFSGGRAIWIYTLIFTLLQLWGRLSASTSSPALPAPTLDIRTTETSDSVVLICKVPEGHQGVLFMLYRSREMVDSQELQSGAQEFQFNFKVKEGDLGKLFCCLYKDQGGPYSPFSPYLRLQLPKAPPRSIPSFPPPVLSVEPSGGVVKRGDTLSFSCSVPAFPRQSHSQPGYANTPMTFVLLRTAKQTGVTSVVLQPPSSQVSSREPQPGIFTVGPLRGGEEGEYTCIYQFTKKRQLLNSTVSNVVQVTITDLLPVPTLVLQQQTDIWHLLCTGSPAYPGAVFYLYVADNEFPTDTQHANAIHHQATFPVPVQDSSVVLYQCQYSVLLGKKWNNSERSHSVAIIRGTSPPSSSDLSGVDWPLVLGSASAVVLFLCSVALATVMAHRKVKAAAEEKKKRQEAQFWTQVHAKDHVVDLTLRRSSFTSQEWASGDTETVSGAPLWNPLSTFSTPIY